MRKPNNRLPNYLASSNFLHGVSSLQSLLWLVSTRDKVRDGLLLKEFLSRKTNLSSEIVNPIARFPELSGWSTDPPDGEAIDRASEIGDRSILFSIIKGEFRFLYEEVYIADCRRGGQSFVLECEQECF